MQRSTPRTIDELILQYDTEIRRFISTVSRGYARIDDVEDMRQQVLLRCHEKDVLRKYDPKKSSFLTYLFWVVRSVVVNQFDRNTRDPLNTAFGLVERLGEHGDVTPGYLVLETFQSHIDESFERRLLAQDVADQFEAHLARQSRPWGPTLTLPDGTPARRSLALVFQLMRRTMEVKDIAAALQVTPQAVFGYLKRIRVEAQTFAQQALAAPV